MLFILGLILGGILGVVIMCIMSVAKEADGENNEKNE